MSASHSYTLRVALGPVAAWQVNPSAYSYNMERRVLQFVRPDEQIVPSIRGITN